MIDLFYLQCRERASDPCPLPSASTRRSNWATTSITSSRAVARLSATQGRHFELFFFCCFLCGAFFTLVIAADRVSDRKSCWSTMKYRGVCIIANRFLHARLLSKVEQSKVVFFSDHLLLDAQPGIPFKSMHEPEMVTIQTYTQSTAL